MADEVKPELMVKDKKAFASWKTNNELHVMLCMKQNGLTKSQAGVQAYFEGVEGLNKRLSPKV